MSTIEVGKILVTSNSAHGVKVFHEYYNAGEKEIKYITFSYVPYNPVNDVVACTASGKTEVSGKLTGPIPPKHKSYIAWENMWYNPTVTKAVLTKMHIQFMDNTEELIEGKDIIFMDDPESVYCRDQAERKRIEAEKEAERIRIEVPAKKLSDDNITTDIISAVFSEFKDDEETLLKILGKVDEKVTNGYLIGDYIETNYASNEKLMEKAVSFWRGSVFNQQNYYGKYVMQILKSEGFPEKYAAKIRKYDPTYVIPEEASGEISRVIGKLLGRIISMFKK